jgi:hypothetical protein
MTEPVTPQSPPKSPIAWIVAGLLAVVIVAGTVFINAKLHNRSALFAATRAELNESKANAAQLQTQLTQAKAGAAQLQAQLDQSKANASQLQTQLAQAKADSAQLQTQLDQAKAGAAQLQGQLAQAKAAVAQSQAQTAQSKANAAQLQTQLDQAKAGAAQLQTQLDQAMADFLPSCAGFVRRRHSRVPQPPPILMAPAAPPSCGTRRRPNSRAPEVVSRGALRPVHPLGRLRRARRRVAGQAAGAEWIMNRGKIPVADYRCLASDFTAAKYDPEAWAQLAADAGMKYVVITAKHHDGFALFDSAFSDWNAVKASGASAI